MIRNNCLCVCVCSSRMSSRSGAVMEHSRCPRQLCAYRTLWRERSHRQVAVYVRIQSLPYKVPSKFNLRVEPDHWVFQWKQFRYFKYSTYLLVEISLIEHPVSPWKCARFHSINPKLQGRTKRYKLRKKENPFLL